MLQVQENCDVLLFSSLVPSDYMWALLPDVVVVIISEVVVDVIKHAFITKFNEIPADVSAEGDVSLPVLLHLILLIIYIFIYSFIFRCVTVNLFIMMRFNTRHKNLKCKTTEFQTCKSKDD